MTDSTIHEITEERQGVYTLGIKRREETILPGSERGLNVWRSTFRSIVVVIVPKAEGK